MVCYVLGVKLMVDVSYFTRYNIQVMNSAFLRDIPQLLRSLSPRATRRNSAHLWLQILSACVDFVCLYFLVHVFLHMSLFHDGSNALGIFFIIQLVQRILEGSGS